MATLRLSALTWKRTYGRTRASARTPARWRAVATLRLGDPILPGTLLPVTNAKTMHVVLKTVFLRRSPAHTSNTGSKLALAQQSPTMDFFRRASPPPPRLATPREAEGYRGHRAHDRNMQGSCKWSGRSWAFREE